MEANYKPERSPVTGIKLSSVVPARVTGQNRAHHLTAMDLAVKLHYIRAVYFFKSPPDQLLTISDLKKPMFHLLEIFYSASGRIRRNESDPKDGRPYIRCNDGGVRIVEAYVEDLTVEEWLRGMTDDDHQRFLVYGDHVLGPDLGFSPLVFLQITLFKCGGVSFGLSWAHVLGDFFTVSAFMNTFAQILAGHDMPELPVPVPQKLRNSKWPPSHNNIFSLKKIDPVGDCWIYTNKRTIGTHTFCLSRKQLDCFIGTIKKPEIKLSYFDVISAMIWGSLLKIDNKYDSKIVTLCTRKENETKNLLNNAIQLSVVKAPVFSENQIDVYDLAIWIVEKRVKENYVVDETIECDGGVSDFIMYGANLTFVDLEGADLYGMKLKGVRPSFVNYGMHGVGDEGVVLVYQGPEAEKDEIFITVTMVMPDDKLEKLRTELENRWEFV